ncbi:MAG: YceI family protein [Steroidobacteraceae bacterium]
MKSTIIFLFAAAALGSIAQTTAADAPPAGHYTLDKAHSTITFRVSHMGFSFYTASFAKFDASLDFDPAKLETAKLEATIDAASLAIPAPPEGFLEILLGPVWLNTDRFPTITYRSTQVRSIGTNTATVAGNLTLNGKTAPVTLEVTFNGGYAGKAGFDPNARVGFSAQGSFKRSDFGVLTGIPPAGSMMGVGDQVSFVIETEFHGPALSP